MNYSALPGALAVGERFGRAYSAQLSSAQPSKQGSGLRRRAMIGAEEDRLQAPGGVPDRVPATGRG